MSALYTKISPKGIDIPIQNLQTHLYNELSSTWSTSDYNSYGRCYKNIGSDGGLLPEVYAGADNVTLLDVDKVDAFSFFVVSDDITYENDKYVAEIGIIFFCNVKSLKTTITHRADEEVRSDVLLLLEDWPTFDLTGVQTGTVNVFAEFDESLIESDDLQPYHCFRVNGEIRYNINENCE